MTTGHLSDKLCSIKDVIMRFACPTQQGEFARYETELMNGRLEVKHGSSPLILDGKLAGSYEYTSAFSS